LLLAQRTTFAGNASWQATAATGDWNTASNWTAGGPPNGFSDTATFDVSTITGVSLSANTEVNSIVFDSGASAYTVTTNTSASTQFGLTISGTGIVNDSGETQNFVTSNNGGLGFVQFMNSATAGTMTSFTIRGGLTGAGAGSELDFFNTSTATSANVTTNGGTSGFGGGVTRFFDNSTAAHAVFTTNGGMGGGGGETQFHNSSTAGNGAFTNNGGTASGSSGGRTVFGSFSNDTATAANATITNNGATNSNAIGGVTQFYDNTTAANSTIINNGAAVIGQLGGGGSTDFLGSSTAGGSSGTAGNATLIANGGLVVGAEGGVIYFAAASTGGTARVEVFGNGSLDISAHDSSAVTVGSVEGTGNVFLGRRTLTVGSNNLSTTFSGTMQDGGQGGGVGGSFAKIGSGTLALSGPNTYTGGTTVSGGTLLVNNTSGSGSGTLNVNAGALGGTGKIVGAVTVGTGSGPGSVLSPGQSLGTLTIQSTLTLNSDATYNFELNSSTGAADKVIANGVTIGAGAQFSFTDLGGGSLATGTVFTLIDNTAASAISGTFNNLADGSTFTANGNTFLVSYEGGEGNNLTLQAVPEPASWVVVSVGASMLFALTSLRRRTASLPNYRKSTKA
jgi:hypothetical protein